MTPIYSDNNEAKIETDTIKTLKLKLQALQETTLFGSIMFNQRFSLAFLFHICASVTPKITKQHSSMRELDTFFPSVHEIGVLSSLNRLKKKPFKR